MKKYHLIFFFIISIHTYSQKNEVDFSNIVQYYKQFGYNDYVDLLKQFGDTVNQNITLKEYQNKFLKDITNHSLYKVFDDTNKKNDEKAKEKYISISKNPIYFKLKDTVIENPYIKEIKKKKNDEYKPNYDNTYPLSYSVIYNDHIITLFEPGKFICVSTKTYKRNKKLENKLNVRKFQYHWIIDGKLIAKSNKKILYWNGSKWKKNKVKTILKKQPKLFESKEYLVFSDCFGEFGGKVYFYNKKTRQTHFTNSTCAVRVYKEQNKYFILENLGHMMGLTRLKYITNPDDLPIITISDLKNRRKKKKCNCNGNSSKIQTAFEYFGFQIFSSFSYKKRKLYLANIGERTLLIEIEKDNFKIVNPLFNDDLYTHDPVTNYYDNSLLINLDFYGIAGEREVSLLLIKDSKITRINWNNNYR